MQFRCNLLRIVAAAVAALLVIVAACWAAAADKTASATVALRELPAEAQQTVRLVREGGPFPYTRDGAVFGNFERLLPRRERGYYREYTVATPGLKHRGARRIVAGRDGELYYTEDHYRSFKRIRE